MKGKRNSDPTTSLSQGEWLRRVFGVATVWLERNADAINSINVYPVPDGDTGTNMYLTMVAAMGEADKVKRVTIGAVARALARGALMGARGNSGAILSQALQGFAASLYRKRRLNAPNIAAALAQAAVTARKAVSDPVEGTILTALSTAAAAASKRAEKSGSLFEVVMAAVVAARKAVKNTPKLLPMLREAGVVDAGALAVQAIMDAVWRYLKKGSLDGLALLAVSGPELAWLEKVAALHKAGKSAYGRCVQFLLTGSGLKPEAVLEQMSAFGDCVIVGVSVEEEDTLTVHLHTADEDAVLRFATSLGEVKGLKVEDMDAQVRRIVRKAQAGERVDTVVVIPPGEGLIEVISGLNATVIVLGGMTMNPSVEDIRKAIDDDCPCDSVIVLPGHRNVVMVARQAATQSKKTVRVLATATFMPREVAALLAFSAEVGLDENAAAMEEAYQGVCTTIEATIATRPAKIGKVAVREGQAIASLDGKLVVAEDSISNAVCSCLEEVEIQPGSHVTIYYGADFTREDAQELAKKIRGEYPDLDEDDVEVVPGGQPLYHCIVSVE